MKRDGRIGPTPDDLEAELGAMGLLDLVEEACVRMGATLPELFGRAGEHRIARARGESMRVIRAISDKVTGRPIYSFAAIGAMFDRDHKLVSAAIRRRDPKAIKRTSKAKASKVKRGLHVVATPVEVHVWIANGAEAFERIDPDRPVLCDGGGNVIVEGRIYRGRKYAGRRLARIPSPKRATSTIPEAPASGTRRSLEAA